jgi:hypothetical protein
MPHWTDTTLILHITTPTVVRSTDNTIGAQLDTFLQGHHQFTNHTVAETIFPGYEYVRHGVDGVYRIYPDEIYPHIARHQDMRRWGTYAFRLLRRRTPNGNTYNPLEDCIRKMKDRPPKRATYELGFGFGFDLATYDDDTDRFQRMGGPCLSHVSFKLIAGEVHLTALYRSHYYVHRAFGNLLGLARLQSFVADQVGVAVGPLVCHSTMARLEHGHPFEWNRTAVNELLLACEHVGRQPAEGMTA